MRLINKHGYKTLVSRGVDESVEYVFRQVLNLLEKENAFYCLRINGWIFAKAAESIYKRPRQRYQKSKVITQEDLRKIIEAVPITNGGKHASGT